MLEVSRHVSLQKFGYSCRSGANKILPGGVTGVTHRHIKPDNFILTKTDTSIHNKSNTDDWVANDAFWDDKAVFNGWKVVLVDF